MTISILLILHIALAAVILALAARWLALRYGRSGLAPAVTTTRSPTPLVGGSRNRDPSPGLRCSFCGKRQDRVRKLVAGPSVFICDECVCESLRILRLTLPADSEDRPCEAKVVGELDKAVAGQGRAKRTLALAVRHHLRRCRNPRFWDDCGLPFGVLLAGGTAAIRRRMMKVLAEVHGVPLIALDAAELLTEGDRISALKALFVALCEPCWDRGDLPPCILFVDNMDKTGKSPAAGSLQRALVGIVDGCCGPAWDLWGAPAKGSAQVHMVCGGDFPRLAGSNDPPDSAALRAHGLCASLADRLPSIAVLGQDSVT